MFDAVLKRPPQRRQPETGWLDHEGDAADKAITKGLATHCFDHLVELVDDHVGELLRRVLAVDDRGGGRSTPPGYGTGQESDRSASSARTAGRSAGQSHHGICSRPLSRDRS